MVATIGRCSARPTDRRGLVRQSRSKYLQGAFHTGTRSPGPGRGRVVSNVKSIRQRQPKREISSSSSGTQATGTNIGAGIGSGGVGSTVNGTTYSPGLDASWEIDIFGGIRRGIEAATADEAAIEAKLHNARVSLVAEVARNYVELRSYQCRLAIAKDNLASQSETAQITEWRYQAGLANASDVEQAKTSREQTRAGLPDLEVGLRSAENRLAVLLGRNPGSLRQQLADPKQLPTLPTNIATGIPTDVLRQRPDLIAAEHTLAAETARVGQKLAKRFPSLNLNASLNWYTFASSGISTVIQSIGASLGTTLFDAGRLRAAVDIQSAVQEQALMSYWQSPRAGGGAVHSIISDHLHCSKECRYAITASAVASSVDGTVRPSAFAALR